MKTPRSLSAIISLLLIFSGCAKPINISTLSMGQDYCQPNTYFPNTPIHWFNHTEIEKIRNILPEYSLHNLYTANAIGILPLLIKKDNAKNDSLFDKKALQFQILLQIQQASEEIDGLAATLDCEGEKVDQIANYLDKINQKRNNKLTIASIVIGSITTIATVAIKKNATQNTVAIGGGLLTSGVGAMTINPAGKKVRWPQNRNLLGTIWTENNSESLISPTIWYMLTEKEFSNSKKISLAESIKQRWLTINFQEEISAEDEITFFKKGGVYAADDLHMRANMLNELQATIRSLHQDLASFTNNIAQGELMKR